jgi:polyphenol oxidase
MERKAMLKKEVGSLTLFEFSLLQHLFFIKHGCFSRKGGLSAPPFDSLNIRLFPEENPAFVLENRARIQKALGTESPLVTLEQVHGATIAVVKHLPKNIPLSQCDAVITNVPNIPLTIMHADCQACLIVDCEHRAIAAVHSGWRGNVQNIYGKVIEKLISEYGSKPEQLYACVGPSLGPCHAEFKEWEKEWPKEFWPYKKENNIFDLWEIAFKQLTESGLKKDHIEIAKICSFDEKEHFFSYRRDGLTGRNATCIMLTA